MAQPSESAKSAEPRDESVRLVGSPTPILDNHAAYATIEVVDARVNRPARSRSAAKTSSDAWVPTLAPASEAGRVAQMLLPSAWGLLAGAILMAWRLLTLFARGALVSSKYGDLALGLLSDAAIGYGLMASVRMLSAVGAKRIEPQGDVTRNASLAFALLWMCATLLRLAGLVQAALNHRALDSAFWLTMLREPGVWIFSGAVWAAVITALATALLVRYCMTSDMEIAQALDDVEPRNRLLGFTGMAMGIALLIVVAAHAHSHGRHDAASALPELTGLDTLAEALHDPLLRRPAEE